MGKHEVVLRIEPLGLFSTAIHHSFTYHFTTTLTALSIDVEGEHEEGPILTGVVAMLCECRGGFLIPLLPFLGIHAARMCCVGVGCVARRWRCSANGRRSHNPRPI
jgi:hypothetical protein